MNNNNNNIPFLPEDIFKLIINIRNESMREDTRRAIDFNIDSYKCEWEDNFIYVDNELSYEFVKTNTIYNDRGQVVQDIEYYDPFTVLKNLRDRKIQ